MSEQDKDGAAVATAEPDTKASGADNGESKPEDTAQGKTKDWAAIQAAIDAIADDPDQKKAVESLVNKEADRRVSKGIEAARRKWEEEQAAKLEELKTEEERKRMEEQGKYQELAEDYKAKLDALEANEKRREFVEKARATLRDPDINTPELEDVLLKDLNSIEGIKGAAMKVRELINKQTEVEVNKRLETGGRPKGAGGGYGTPAGKPSTWTVAQKTEYRKEHGDAAWQRLVAQEQAEKAGK